MTTKKEIDAKIKKKYKIEGRWCRVSWKDKIGWAFDFYLSGKIISGEKISETNNVSNQEISYDQIAEDIYLIGASSNSM